MATITLTIGANSQSRTIPDADAARMRTAYRTLLGLSGSATSAQIVAAIADDVFRRMKAAVVAEERAAAARAASDAVADIPVT